MRILSEQIHCSSDWTSCKASLLSLNYLDDQIEDFMNISNSVSLSRCAIRDKSIGFST